MRLKIVMLFVVSVAVLTLCVTVFTSFYLLKDYFKDGSHVESYSEFDSEYGVNETRPLEYTGAESYIPERENLNVPNFKEESDMSHLIGDRDVVERVVMMESGNQCYEGKMAVAQCIRNTAEKKGITASEVVLVPGQYASMYSGEVSWEVKEAVSDVFDRGLDAVDADIMYFYSTVGDFYSRWHENSLEYVCTIQDHKFFKECEYNERN